MFKLALFFTVVIFCTKASIIRFTQSPVCCTPDQWEAKMLMGNGNTFIDAESGSGVGTVVTYMNGTMLTAYDFTNKRSLINGSVVQISPLIPHPVVQKITLIRDYKHGVEYQIEGGGKCEKSKLDPLSPLCIPEDAVNLGSGTLGKQGVPVFTFAHTLPDYPYQFQTTVTQKDCLPVHVMFLVKSSESGSGAMYSLEVLDVTTGIKDPSIFHIPPQCNSTKVTGDTSQWLKPLL